MSLSQKRNRTLMTLDYVYKEKGGSQKILEMANDHARLQTIANHFGFTRERASQILKVLLGVPYSTYLASRGARRSGVTRPVK